MARITLRADDRQDVIKVQAEEQPKLVLPEVEVVLPQKQVEYITITKEVPVEVIKEVEKIVYVDKPIEIIKEVPVEVRVNQYIEVPGPTKFHEVIKELPPIIKEVEIEKKFIPPYMWGIIGLETIALIVSILL